jgi:predicted phage terminase large subunit-like protein
MPLDPDEDWRFDLSTYATRVSGGKWKPYPWVVHVADRVQEAVVAGAARVIVEAPPQHGKSQLVARWLSTWFLDHWPDKRVLLASYASNLASGHSLKVRREFESNELTWTRISSDKAKHNDWETTKGGALKAVGFESGIPGIPADLLIIDDPHAGWAAVQSPAQRQKVIDTFLADLDARLQKGASVILIQTRWHKRDLAGYLLSEHPADWTEIRLPALAEENDPLGRDVGEALCPELHPREELLAKKAAGSRIFAGLYQQRPSEEAGNIIKREWIQYYGGPTGVELPAVPATMHSWDMNFKKTRSGSYVAGTCWAEKDADIYLLDMRRGRWSYAEAKKELPSFLDAWALTNAILIEEAANGHAILSDLRGVVRGLVPVSTGGLSKESRLELVAPLFEAGNVWLPHSSIAPWVGEYVEEIVCFPNSDANDLVDSTSQALDRYRKARVVQAGSRGWGMTGVTSPSEFLQ